jgi:integrase/recombinase XerD
MRRKEKARMVMMNSEPVQWSEEKQNALQEHLVGRWAEDIWIFTPSNPKRSRGYLRFTLSSPSLKTEVKYAIWNKFSIGEHKVDSQQSELCWVLPHLIDWLNHYTQSIQSLMEKTIEEWEMSLQDFLIQTGHLRIRKFKKLSATQEYLEYSRSDRHILLLRQLYAAIRAAYDDRLETERDIWDMQKMGLAVNLAGRKHLLNFTYIAQPWLRCLAKEYIKYNMALNSPGDCSAKLQSIRKFSEFLTERAPETALSATNIDRGLIVQYIEFLASRKISDTSRLHLLSGLRTFLETCARSLKIEDVPQERLIFNEDFPKLPQRQSREIPEEVLVQLREHLNTLPTATLRKVVILLECGIHVTWNMPPSPLTFAPSTAFFGSFA